MPLRWMEVPEIMFGVYGLWHLVMWLLLLILASPLLTVQSNVVCIWSAVHEDCLVLFIRSCETVLLAVQRVCMCRKAYNRCGKMSTTSWADDGWLTLTNASVVWNLIGFGLKRSVIYLLLLLLWQTSSQCNWQISILFFCTPQRRKYPRRLEIKCGTANLQRQRWPYGVWIL